MAWWRPSDVKEQWGEYVDHWESQISKHRKPFQLTSAGLLVLIPGVGIPLASTATAALAATWNANELQKKREALEAAKTAIAQTPYQTESEMREGSGIGATGEIAFTRGISQWIPIALVFVVVMYFLFKR